MKSITELNQSVIVGVQSRSAIAQVYKYCIDNNQIDNHPEDNNIFFRLWELHSRQFYFEHQLIEIKKKSKRLLTIIKMFNHQKLLLC